jgi:hypothetical protein
MCELLLFFSLLLFSLAHFLFFFYVITDIDEQKRFVKTYLSASVTWEFTVLNLIKRRTSPLVYHLSFIVGLAEGEGFQHGIGAKRS